VVSGNREKITVITALSLGATDLSSEHGRMQQMSSHVQPDPDLKNPEKGWAVINIIIGDRKRMIPTKNNRS
jgi:hypothetical protein